MLYYFFGTFITLLTDLSTLFLTYLVPFFGVVFVITAVHELGHYYASRSIGARVERVSFGLGKKIFSTYDRHQTEWCFSLIPVGGYIKIAGDETAGISEQNNEASNLPPEDVQNFRSHSLRAKIWVIIAGPLANYLLAFVIMSSIAFFHGVPTVSNHIHDVETGSPAEQAGLQKGDILLQINDQAIHTIQDVHRFTQQATETGSPQTLSVELLRNQESFNVFLTPEITEIEGQPSFRLGIRFGVVMERHSMISALRMTHYSLLTLSQTIVESVYKTFTHEKNREIGSVITIAQLSGKIVKKGVLPLLWFTAVLSVNLCIINLLPFLPLDGGRIVLLCIESIFKNARHLEFIRLYYLSLGLAFIAVLSIVALYNDVRNLFS